MLYPQKYKNDMSTGDIPDCDAFEYEYNEIYKVLDQEIGKLCLAIFKSSA